MTFLTAVVESVRDGGTIRLMLVPSMNYITLMLTGIRCPSFKPDGGAEDFADEVNTCQFRRQNQIKSIIPIFIVYSIMF